MNTTKINELKDIYLQAVSIYETEKLRLTNEGVKSKDRYELLKHLKIKVDETHSVYASYTNKQIHKELDLMIAADLPKKQEAARNRSAWKMAKFNAAAKN